MSTTELIEKIKALTPQQQREIEAHVESLAGAAASLGKRDVLLERMAARRERIFRRQGELPDSTEMIREWRDGAE